MSKPLAWLCLIFLALNLIFICHSLQKEKIRSDTVETEYILRCVHSENGVCDALKIYRVVNKNVIKDTKK